VQAEKYRGLSEANALREIAVPAKRGLIMDRRGKILADNQAAYSLQIDRVVLKPLVKADQQHRERLLEFLSQVLAMPPQELDARWQKQSAGIPNTQPFVLAEDLSMSQVASLQAQSIAFPEINVVPVQRRSYPYSTMAAHVLGFIGEVSEKELTQNTSLKQGDLIGKRGVELMYDGYLRGRSGVQQLSVDHLGRVTGVVDERDPVPGFAVVQGPRQHQTGVRGSGAAHIVAQVVGRLLGLEAKAPHECGRRAPVRAVDDDFGQ